MRLPNPRTKFVLAVFVAGGTMLTQAQVLQGPTLPGQTLQAEEAAPTPTPAHPFQQPPSPPQVTYSAGQLEVKANNSTFADVVNAIQTATGASIEGTEPSSTERIFGQFGPAAPSIVLGEILSDSPYDFIIVGSAVSSQDQEQVQVEDANAAIQHIILSARKSLATQRAQASAQQLGGGAENRQGVVTDASSYTDPQWAVPQYRYVPPANGQQPVPGQPMPGQSMPGQPGFQPAGQTGENGAQPDPRMQGRIPQHWGARPDLNGLANPNIQPNGIQPPQQDPQ